MRNCLNFMPFCVRLTMKLVSWDLVVPSHVWFFMIVFTSFMILKGFLVPVQSVMSSFLYRNLLLPILLTYIHSSYWRFFYIIRALTYYILLLVATQSTPYNLKSSVIHNKSIHFGKCSNKFSFFIVLMRFICLWDKYEK